MIYLAADHAGYDRKEMIKDYLKSKGHETKDFGANEINPSDDYPDFAYPMAQAVVKDIQRGIVFCGNAQGVCIVANKVKGVRAALGYNRYAAKSSREDDDTNILCVPGRDLTDEEAKSIVDIWLSTGFSNADRHIRRINKLKNIEDSI